MLRPQASPRRATSYEGDYLLGILAFYMMLGHLLVGLRDYRVQQVVERVGIDGIAEPTCCHPERAELRDCWISQLTQVGGVDLCMTVELAYVVIDET